MRPPPAFLRKAVLALRVFFAALVMAVSVALPASAAEEITRFVSRAQIGLDGRVTVREDITVRAEGLSIRRGIFRYFPTKRPGADASAPPAGFKLLDVFRDGVAEPHHVVSRLDGKTVYIGEETVFLEPGLYTYTLIYETTRQLLFFDGRDEFNWNVTGTEWAFPILSVDYEVTFPGNVNAVDVSSYTGRPGERGQAFSVVRDEPGEVQVITQGRLEPGEGLTVSVSWPEGAVERPTALEGFIDQLISQRATVVGLAGALIMLGFYLIAWTRVGRDPEAGTIIPHFRPPSNLSPAAIRYVKRMGADRKTFASALISMAVQGVLTIEDAEDGFVVTRTGKGFENLFPGERRVAKTLFDSHDSFEIKQDNHRKIRRAIEKLTETLETEYENQLFVTNIRFFAIGVLGSLAVIAIIALASNAPAEGLFIGLWLSVWSGGTSFVVLRAWRALKNAFSQPDLALGAKFSALLTALFALPFVGGAFLALGILSSFMSIAPLIAILIIIVINVTFFQLLKAPTLKGRAVLDEIEGFKRFLETTEARLLKGITPEQKSPRYYERMLPYAIALDLENAWGKRFSSLLNEAGAPAARHSHVSWYSGGDFGDLVDTAFARNLSNSVASSVTSAAQLPNSNSSGSGFSGGGFSGGGGGGGGGGGW